MEDFAEDNFDELIEIDDPFAIFKNAKRPHAEESDDSADDGEEARR